MFRRFWIDHGPATFASGVVVDEITSPDFQVPTTVAAFDNRFYLVNARFGVPSPETASYTMAAVRR